MPYHIRWHNSQGHTFYVAKGAYSQTQDIKRARIYPSMGAVKNSLAHWSEVPEDLEVVELALTETGVVLLACEVMAEVLEERERLEQERQRLYEERVRERELADLKRLKEKYGG